MKRVLLPMVALALALSIGIEAQETQQGGYYQVTCRKARDGKTAEFRQFVMNEGHKLTQVDADAGHMAADYVLRSVLPRGAAATCDFAFIEIFPGALPAPAGQDVAGLLQKAGSSSTAGEFRTRLSSLSSLIFSEIWRTDIGVGEMRKGDYVFINHMKVPNMSAYMELERTIWKPMAESWVKDGTLRGWNVSHPVLPAGDGVKYQAVTVDVMPSWDSAFKPLPLEATFKKVHADKHMDEVLDKLGKSRSLDLRELMVVDDKIVPAGKASSAGGQ